jgi:pilus assembly protein CpaF
VLLESKFLTQAMADFLRDAVQARVNIIVSGNTSSGKTTLLNVLSSFIGESERIITIEDTPELQLQHKNVVRLGTQESFYETREDAITMRHLVRNSLRMRPDRLVIGEVRGEEALDLIHALNTGHSGCMSTLHANSPRDALTRLTHMIHLANTNLPTKYIQAHIPLSFELIVQTHRDETGRRTITHISELVGMEGEIFVLKDLFTHPADARNAAMPVIPLNRKMRKLRLV